MHTVVWGYANKTTYTPCYASEECNITDDSFPVQLYPIEMQQGSVLRFKPSSHEGLPFTMKAMMVDEQGFLACNASRALSTTVIKTNDTVDVDSSLLTPGTHYFIEASDGFSIFDCNLGLRVRVVVKPSVCGDEGQDVTCGGQGLCATFHEDPDYKCLCCGTYEGAGCGQYNPCLSNPCSMGGQCVQDSEDSEKFTCECSLEYYGTLCQKRREDLCEIIKCQNNGTCLGNSTHFQCECPIGLEGSHCEVDTDDCSPSPCEHGACIDDRGGFLCQCKPGYYGETCSQLRQGCSLSPCKNGGYCQDLTTDPNDFRFTCHCLPGWSGKDCSTKVAACESDTCSYHGQCHEDLKTGFRCSCHAGFTGTKCEININDCSPNPCKYGGHCKDGVNSHICMCINSHMGSNCQYAMDLFTPILEGPGSAGGLSREHAQNLYIVAGVLGAVVLFVVVVLVVCFCRVSGAYKHCCSCWRFKSWRNYHMHRDSLVVGVDVSSANDCPLAVDSFYRQDDLDPRTDAYARSFHGSFENQTV